MAKKKVTRKKAVKRKKGTRKKVGKSITATKRVTEKKVGKHKKFPPAYFLSLSVENVRCFGPKQTLDLSDGKGRPARWTVILGDNNAGKTTLLQCLVALEPAMDAPASEGSSLISKLFDRGKYEWNLYRRREKDTTLISGEACFGTKLSQLEKTFAKTSLEVGIRDISYIQEGKGDRWGGRGRVYRRAELGGLICYGYGASRVMGVGSLSEKSPGDASISLFSDNAELINAEEWLLQADYAASKSTSRLKSRAKRRRDQVREVLIHLLPGVDDIRFKKPVEKQPKPGVEFKTPYGWVTLRSLSLGYKTLIGWMVDLANRMFERYPQSPNPLAEPAVVLVDEIDLHLHPRWQRTLMSYLSEMFENTQFIVTAHSPLVVQAATEANLVLLKREDDHVVIDNNPQSIKGWRADQVLTSDLFGLPSALSIEEEKLQNQRRKILSKGKLTKADKNKLKSIESKMGDLPTAQTPEDIEAMNIIKRAAKRLKK